jgi:hypothetical protein
MKTIHPLELGATLFVPATHKDIEKILGGEKYPHLKSVVLDTEDALLPSQTSQAVARIEVVLAGLQQKSPFIFYALAIRRYFKSSWHVRIFKK